MTNSPSKSPLRVRVAALAVAALATASPGLSSGQAASALAAPSGGKVAVPPSVFKCESGRELQAEFVNRNSQLVAIVDAGDGPHILPLRPWTGGLPQITWSDGQRTLTWSAGVQLHFMDGATHRMCGRTLHQH